MKTLLPTSTAGSLPKPSWLATPETLWSPWKLEGEELVAGKQDALRLAVDDQRRAGIDIVGDGEQTRQHFVTTFIEHLDGVDFEKNPELLAQPKWGFKAAAWFWTTRNLNALADAGNFDQITYRINGGYNGKPDRDARYATAKAALVPVA